MDANEKLAQKVNDWLFSGLIIINCIGAIIAWAGLYLRFRCMLMVEGGVCLGIGIGMFVAALVTKLEWMLVGYDVLSKEEKPKAIDEAS